jgi:hypothetical protein
MSTAVPPMPSQVEQPKLSESQRIVNTYIAPSKTFEDIRRNASWWAPWLLLSISSLTFGYARFEKVDAKHMVEQRIEQSNMAQQRMEQLPPSQRDAAISAQAKIAQITFFAGPIGFLLGGLIVAVIFWAVFNFGFAAEIPFQRYFSIAFYAFLPVVISTLLTAISVGLNSDPENYNEFNPLASNPGYFMDRGEHKFLYGVASGLDVFPIWVLVLLGLGIAKNSVKGKVSPGAAIATVLVCYGIWVVGVAGFASAF